jgi:sugar lactone lactonase YvrE
MSSNINLKIGEPVSITATGDKCGEGISWEAASQCIYWTDINRFLVRRYNLERAELRTWFFSEPATCVLATDRQDTLLLVLGSKVVLREPKHDVRQEPLFNLPGWPFVRCNDAAIDQRGDL